MVTETTQGVKVSVEVFFQDEYSNPLKSEFAFAYKVTIENSSDNTVRLVERHWHIFDSNGKRMEVKGKGVVGKQPVLEPGLVHQYVSGCQLNSDMGKMHGTYTMERLSDGSRFYVNIPTFELIAPFKLS